MYKLYLQSHIITETNSSECYKAVVETVEITPSFVPGKHCSTYKILTNRGKTCI